MAYFSPRSVQLDGYKCCIERKETVEGKLIQLSVGDIDMCSGCFCSTPFKFFGTLCPVISPMKNEANGFAQCFVI